MCNKIRYLTRKIAKRALKVLNKSGALARRLTNVYLCQCGYWHTTSIRAKKSRSITKYGFKRRKNRKKHDKTADTNIDRSISADDSCRMY